MMSALSKISELLGGLGELLLAARDSVRQWQRDWKQGQLSEGSKVLIGVWLAAALLLALMCANLLL
ncbi:hypothetical protein A7P95_01800 [Eikenella longinqua]|uniref:Uncharacterized protein n=2 Tax=Eikenella TaxID=538 RepID=A0A1A9S2F4_9NEIS|nr:hypothetical protein [Eikenella longinqua]OAM31246.1 hypothetical protein A7P95_01800 [Eikenella longinqua]